MAITITTDLAANVAAFAPCVVEGTSSRYPFTSDGTRFSQGVIGIASSTSDKLIIKLDDDVSGTFEIGDIVELTGLTGDALPYNGRYKYLGVDDPDTDVMILDYEYTGSTVLSLTGTVTRRNDNLQIVASVVDNTFDVVATYYEQVLFGGAFKFDLQKALQSKLSSAFSLTEGEGDASTLSHNYTVYYYELFQGADYTTTENSTTITAAVTAHSERVAAAGGIGVDDEVVESLLTYICYLDTDYTSVIAHRTTAYDTDNVSGTELLTGAMYGKDKVVFHFMTDKTSDVRIRIVTNAGYTTTTEITTITRQHAIITFNWPAQSDVVLTAAPYFYLDVQWNDAGTWTSIKTPILFKLITECHSTQLYYVNRLGGYESYKFTSYDDTQRTVKVDKYTAEAWQERTLEGQVYPRGTFQTIRDVITSPEVYDEDGTLVEVLSDSLNYRAEEVSPFITIRYDETFIQ